MNNKRKMKKKIGEQDGGTGPVCGGWYGEGGKGYGRVNIVQMLYTHVCK
jgi:hypothetical protein